MQHVFVVHCNGMQTLGIATEVDMPIYSYESLILFFSDHFFNLRARKMGFKTPLVLNPPLKGNRDSLAISTKTFA